MLLVNCEQRSEEWIKARAGIPTSSSFSKILTSTGKLSSQADDFMYKLIYERISGTAAPHFQSESMHRGTDLEDEARLYYEAMTDREVLQVGFVYLDERKTCGCSPDGLLDGGGLEIKCPEAPNHIKNMRKREIPTQYKLQVQGNMWICERQTWDFMSYHPDLDAMITVVDRDDALISKLELAIEKFSSLLRECMEELNSNYINKS